VRTKLQLIVVRVPSLPCESSAGFCVCSELQNWVEPAHEAVALFGRGGDRFLFRSVPLL